MNVVKLIFISMGELVFEFLRVIRRNIKLLGTLAYILFPLLGYMYKADMLTMAWILIICAILNAYFKRLDININRKYDNGFPLPSRKFTYDDGGTIDINTEDIPDALQYLNELEEYLYRKGKISGESTMH